MRTERPLHAPTPWTNALLACGAIAGPFFTAVWLVEGATRVDHDPWRHPISSLAFGAGGWTQIASFTVTGLLTLAFALGLRRTRRARGRSAWGPLLVGAVGIDLLGASIFIADPLNGYSPGTPSLPVYYVRITGFRSTGGTGLQLREKAPAHEYAVAAFARTTVHLKHERLRIMQIVISGAAASSWPPGDWGADYAKPNGSSWRFGFR